MKILALDLGLKCGVAMIDGDRMTSNLWRLDESDLPHWRFHALRLNLGVAVESYRPQLVAYEELHFAGGGPAALVSYGGLRAVVLLEAAQSNVKYLGIGPSTWKKAAGLGAGTKAADALAAARARWPGHEFQSHDEAVARWIALAAAAVWERSAR